MPNHEVKKDETFKGLTHETAYCLENYMHFRNVQDEEKKKALDLPNTPFEKNFLENITSDEPKGCWTIQRDSLHT